MKPRTMLARRSGLALLLCLFVVALTSTMLLGILNTLTAESAATRNTADRERALYLAGAGVHHALAELEQDPAFRGSLGPVEFPPGSGETYSVKVGDVSGTLEINSQGTSGAVSRGLQVQVQ